MNTQIDYKTYSDNAASSAAGTAESNANSYSDGLRTDIVDRLYQTGIDIDGNDREITLYGDKVSFRDSAGKNANLQFDTSSNIYRVGEFYFRNGNISTNWDYSNPGATKITKDGTINITGNFSCRDAQITGGLTVAGGTSQPVDINSDDGVSINTSASLGGDTNIGNSRSDVTITAKNSISLNGQVSVEKGKILHIKSDGFGLKIYFKDGKLIIDSDSSEWYTSSSLPPSIGQLYLSPDGEGNYNIKMRGK
jgi:hypothetical protein